jgi:hypothetical protein
MLRIKCVHTLEAMKALFRKCYHSKIGAITELFERFRECVKLSATGALEFDASVAAPSAEEMSAIDCSMEEFLEYVAYKKERRAEMVRELRWTVDKQAAVHEAVSHLANEAPEIFDIDYSIDIKGWLKRNQADIAFTPDVKGMCKPHIFGIEKDADGCTYLYNSYLSGSVKQAREGEIHAYPDQQTGSYTTRSKMYEAASRLPHPPSRMPHRAVAQQELRDTLKAYSAVVLKPAELQELTTHLATMDERVKMRSSQCHVCKRLTEALHSVGVISNRVAATAEEKARAAEQTRKKHALLREQATHLANSDFTAVHSAFVEDDWFSRWHFRAVHYIGPEMLSRAETSKRTEQLRTQRIPYHVHPSSLCSGKGERPVHQTSEREDCRWLQQHGAFRLGQLVVLRSDDRNEPFWLGRIVKFFANDSAQVQHARPAKSGASRGAEVEQLDQCTEGLTRLRPLPIHPRTLDCSDSMDRDAALFHFWSTAGQACCYAVRPSKHAATRVGQPTSLGLFATRAIKEGEFISWYGGYLCWEDDLRKPGACKTHARRVPDSGMVLDGWPLAAAYTRYVASDADALVRHQILPDARFHPREQYNGGAESVQQLLRQFDHMPKGFVANSAGRGGTAQSLANTKTALRACPTLETYGFRQLPCLIASRAMAAGEEILTHYGSNEEAEFRSSGEEDGTSTSMHSLLQLQSALQV